MGYILWLLRDLAQKGNCHAWYFLYNLPFNTLLTKNFCISKQKKMSQKSKTALTAAVARKVIWHNHQLDSKLTITTTTKKDIFSL